MAEQRQLQESEKNIKGHIFWGHTFFPFEWTIKVTFHAQIKINWHILKIKIYGMLQKGHDTDFYILSSKVLAQCYKQIKYINLCRISITVVIAQCFMGFTQDR